MLGKSTKSLASILLTFGTVFMLYQMNSSEVLGGSQKVVQTDLPSDFNHDTTTFPLLGAHKGLRCAQCHLGGNYKSVPRTCEACHNGQIAYGKPQNHLLTTQSCNSCHTLSAWSPASFRHELSMVSGRCDTCHNGQKATGKPQNHVMTTQQCDICHRVTGWSPASFTHDLAQVSGRCDTCHNGQKATGKPQNHIATRLQCDSCHRTTGWIPANFTTHDNPKLIGAHSRLDCKACHVQSSSSAFYRDGTQYGFCANCHTRDYEYPGPGAHKNNPVTKVPFASMQESLRANALCSNCHKHADYREF